MLRHHPLHHRHFFEPLFDFAENPKIEKSDDALNISLDVSNFKPNEVELHVKEGFVIVEGHHSAESIHGSEERHFVQKYKIPADVDENSIQSSLDSKGNLVIAARLKNPEAVEGEMRRKIPIMMSNY